MGIPIQKWPNFLDWSAIVAYDLSKSIQITFVAKRTRLAICMDFDVDSRIQMYRSEALQENQNESQPWVLTLVGKFMRVFPYVKKNLLQFCLFWNRDINGGYQKWIEMGVPAVIIHLRLGFFSLAINQRFWDIPRYGNSHGWTSDLGGMGLGHNGSWCLVYLLLEEQDPMVINDIGVFHSHGGVPQ